MIAEHGETIREGVTAAGVGEDPGHAHHHCGDQEDEADENHETPLTGAALSRLSGTNATRLSQPRSPSVAS